jgi:outer membrane protein OmpA-like peptidoglycan-associated protein
MNAIIKRIELQPTLSRAEKDRIREKVQSAKKMRRIAVIHFNTNAASAQSQEEASIVLQFDQPQVKELLADPRTQLVVLGYADLQGDDPKNLALSNERAQTVLQILVKKCHVLNTMYAIPMGGTDLFDSRAFARNRTVEVWAGQP